MQRPGPRRSGPLFRVAVVRCDHVGNDGVMLEWAERPPPWGLRPRGGRAFGSGRTRAARTYPAAGAERAGRRSPFRAPPPNSLPRATVRTPKSWKLARFANMIRLPMPAGPGLGHRAAESGFAGALAGCESRFSDTPVPLNRSARPSGFRATVSYWQIHPPPADSQAKRGCGRFPTRTGPPDRQTHPVCPLAPPRTGGRPPAAHRDGARRKRPTRRPETSLTTAAGPPRPPCARPSSIAELPNMSATPPLRMGPSHQLSRHCLRFSGDAR